MPEQYTYRVTVTAADAHDILSGDFSEDGTLTYDRSLDFFSFRVQLRAATESTDRAVCDRALALAARAVETFDVDFRDLRASATDVNLIKIRRR